MCAIFGYSQIRNLGAVKEKEISLGLLPRSQKAQYGPISITIWGFVLVDSQTPSF